MVSSSIIVDKYAQAAFNVAKKGNLVEKFLADLKLLSENFSEDFSKALSNPTISKSELVDVMNEVAKKLSISEKVTSFLVVIADARRLNLIKKIYTSFLKLYKADKNILEVELFTTDNLDEEQLNKVNTVLKQRYPNNIIEVNQIIKKDILGGTMIKIGSVMIDATVKNQLENIINECNSAII